ncbi:hypothetical protein [Gimesia sp.]|uniref:hypothetical protein n=1 Tax=Gimesia sp. TaxID=2024833 RepID=UPI003A8F3852
MSENSTKNSTLAFRFYLRKFWLSLLLMTVIFLGAALCYFVVRGSTRRHYISELLKYDAAIRAQYDEYKYDPPVIDAGGGLVLRIGRGQRAVGQVSVGEPPRPLNWIVPVVRDSCFTDVTEIIISDSRFSDSDVELLLAFPELRELDISGTAVTDAGLEKIAALDQLVLLYVNDTAVTEKGLRSLASCRELKELKIDYTILNAKVLQFLKAQLPDCDVRW